VGREIVDFRHLSRRMLACTVIETVQASVQVANLLLMNMQWRAQDFRMGGVEVPQAPRVGRGKGASPSPLGEGSGEGLVLPSQTIFRMLKIPYFDAF